MLIIAGHLQVGAGERATYLDLVTTATQLARRAPGCREFVQAPDPIEPDRIVIYERWESEAHLLAFRSSDPQGEPVALPDVLGADVARYEISAVGAP
ncbi:antibiotic biosynthesis monooxygenase family protein [Nocardioides sp.]|uniref:putative quinol monooxygenase n=1 Tax=Nocardioides sp. TaxID=35761 RepID=UPI00286A6AB9|nr:antibiotic biosynthesis monooxygenase family protein [Nocardioides sp.]